MESSEQRSSPRLALYIIVALSTAFYLLHILRTGFPVLGETYYCLFDDAMISMRYAENLARGHGLVWNTGEKPVEGYTNLLWVLWMAALHLLPIAKSKISLLVMLSGMGLLVGTVILSWRITEKLAPGSTLAPVLAALLTAFHYSLVYWTLRGMEVGLLAAELCLLAYLAIDRVRTMRRLLLAIVVTVLSLLTRPDAITFVAVFWIYYAGGSTTRRLPTLLCGLTTIAFTAAALTGFRLWYYGEALPNTYQLKIGGAGLLVRLARGVPALIDTFRYSLWPFVCVIGVGLWVGGWRQLADPRIQFLVGMPIVQCLYSAYVGADAWEYLEFPNRYISFSMPLVFVAAAVSIERCLDAPRMREGGGLRIIAALVAYLGLIAAFRAYNLHAYVPYRPEGLDSAQETENAVSVAVSGILGFLLIVLSLPAARFLQSRVGTGLTASIDGRRSVIAGVAYLLLAFPTESVPVTKWVFDNADQQWDLVEMTRLGVLLTKSTPEDTSIAVSWAGTVPYFSGRRTIDVLGKSDPVIARLPRKRPFFPGHDKWDYEYSIGQLKPDIICELGPTTDAEHDYIKRIGYKLLPSALMVRAESAPRLRVDLLNTFWKEDGELEKALRR